MNVYRRNVLVGLVVLGSMFVLGWMMLRFAGKTARAFTDPQVSVRFITSRADGLGDGSPIYFRGVEVGRVSKVQLDPINPLQIQVKGFIEVKPVLPGNVEGVIKSQSALGSASAIHLEMVGTPDAAGEIAPVGALDETSLIPLRYLGLDIFPAEFARLADDLAKTSRQVRESNLIPQLSETVVSVREQVVKAGVLIDSMQGMVGDPKLQADVRATVTSLRATAETAESITASLKNLGEQVNELTGQGKATIKAAQGTIGTVDAKVEELSRSLSGRLEQVSKLLDSFKSISDKVDAGQGSAGQLVNDPKLYEGMVDTARLLNATITDLKRLVEQWEQEGVSLKLK